MKAVVVAPLQAGSGRVAEVPDPEMGADEVLVRVRVPASRGSSRSLRRSVRMVSLSDRRVGRA